jgi:hypothetical protein
MITRWPDTITLNADVINRLDISQCQPKAPYFAAECGKEHYRLLCYLSTLWDGAEFCDIGTNEGDSAIALGFNSKNHVHSFDINSYPLNSIPNCTYRIGDYHKYTMCLRMSSVILYDIPHHGTDFVDLCNWLQSYEWNGFLILDDYQFDPVKAADWNKVTVGTKIDATKYGHFSGTGIINFSKEIQFKLE